MKPLDLDRYIFTGPKHDKEAIAKNKKNGFTEMYAMFLSIV